MITTINGCWALTDTYGALAVWNNDRHMPTQAEAENHRILLGESVNQHATHQVTQPCHVITCDVCGLPVDPEGNDEPVHFPSGAAGIREALGLGWAQAGQGLACRGCR